MELISMGFFVTFHPEVSLPCGKAQYPKILKFFNRDAT
jgi:hypothetical protein